MQFALIYNSSQTKCSLSKKGRKEEDQNRALVLANPYSYLLPSGRDWISARMNPKPMTPK